MTKADEHLLIHCSLCGEVGRTLDRRVAMCPECKQSYYMKNGVNKFGKRERYCITCGLYLPKRILARRLKTGERREIAWCTTCLFCVDCRYKFNIHDARRGRIV